MTDTSGPTSAKQFAYYDPASSSWKTWPAISLWGLDEFSETWPKQGMTRSGRAYERRTSEAPTAGSECSSLLKTPTTQLATNGGSRHPDKRKAGGHGPTLADEVEHLLPTPTTSENRGTGSLDGPRNDTLRAQVMLLPTPRATDGTKGGPNQRGSSGDLMLPSAVLLLPTPTATDAKSSSGSNPAWGHGTTLTDAARHLTGASTPPPSTDGPASSAGQLLIPLSLDETDAPA